MSNSSKLRAQRLESLHRMFLKAAEKEPHFYHVACWSEDPTAMETDDRWTTIVRRSPWASRCWFLSPYNGRLQFAGREWTGRFCSPCPAGFLEESRVIGVEEADDIFGRLSAQALLAHRGDRSIEDAAAADETWLEIVYRVLNPEPVVQTNSEQHSILIVGLPANVFSCSADVLELADGKAPATRGAHKASVIPPEDRTIPMSYKKAAKLMGKGNCKDAAEWLSASVKDGNIPCEEITRQSHVFSKQSFPKSVWGQIMIEPGK